MHDKKAVAAGVRKWWTKNIFFLVLVGAILFIASGKLNWWMAWAYLSAMVLIVIANAIAMDPALLAERSQLQEGTKKWDIALAGFVIDSDMVNGLQSVLLCHRTNSDGSKSRSRIPGTVSVYTPPRVHRGNYKHADDPYCVGVMGRSHSRRSGCIRLYRQDEP